MFAKLAILFAKFDSMGLFDALAMLFGAEAEDEDVVDEATTLGA